MELIKYHNDINKLKLGNFTENETDIFFSLLFKAKETKEDIIIMSFLELKALANGDTHNDRFLRNILSLNGKLKSMNQTVEIEKGVYLTFSLFGDILTDSNRKIIEIPINPRFRYLINNIMDNFTVIDLKQLVSLKGNYAKVLYRLLKQFEATKLYTVKLEEFRDLMGVPNTYAMFTIRQKVLKPCMEQLGQYFEGLILEEIKVGRNVSSLKFVWNKKEKRKIKVSKSKTFLGEEDYQKHLEKQQQNDTGLLDELKNERVTITKQKYEKLYSQYLEKYDAKDNPIMKKTFDMANLKKYKIID
ncbi:MAG: replication initiation protein [Cetobacterium sp.]|uniref:replication initiation protein n=1 Tax=Cetobacterium sp. TaxID=2071632 RepID=UPI003EE4C5E7